MILILKEIDMNELDVRLVRRRQIHYQFYLFLIIIINGL
jgi:hypothetical protein